MGTYGPGCSRNCSDHCIRLEQHYEWCRHTNGHCLYGCKDGYRGDTCDISKFIIVVIPNGIQSNTFDQVQ